MVSYIVSIYNLCFHTKQLCIMCSIFNMMGSCNCLIVFTGVLHGAVVLITELCVQNPDTLDQFRKVI